MVINLISPNIMLSPFHTKKKEYKFPEYCYTQKKYQTKQQFEKSSIYILYKSRDLMWESMKFYLVI